MTAPFMEAMLERRLEEAEKLLDLRLPDQPADEALERFMSHRLGQVRSDLAMQRWLARAIVLRVGERPMVGNVGFHGKPGVNAAGNPEAVEIGYGIVPEHRRQGYATEAVGALLDWARGEGIAHFVASVAPDNEPSLKIIRKLGFVRTGEHIDPEDGLEHVFELAD
jgi:[ribosomal protein S5]-alanine N-acetyltransferase